MKKLAILFAVVASSIPFLFCAAGCGPVDDEPETEKSGWALQRIFSSSANRLQFYKYRDRIGVAPILFFSEWDTTETYFSTSYKRIWDFDDDNGNALVEEKAISNYSDLAAAETVIELIDADWGARTPEYAHLLVAVDSEDDIKHVSPSGDMFSFAAASGYNYNDGRIEMDTSLDRGAAILIRSGHLGDGYLTTLTDFIYAHLWVYDAEASPTWKIVGDAFADITGGDTVLSNARNLVTGPWGAASDFLGLGMIFIDANGVLRYLYPTGGWGEQKFAELDVFRVLVDRGLKVVTFDYLPQFHQMDTDFQMLCAVGEGSATDSAIWAGAYAQPGNSPGFDLKEIPVNYRGHCSISSFIKTPTSSTPYKSLGYWISYNSAKNELSALHLNSNAEWVSTLIDRASSPNWFFAQKSVIGVGGVSNREVAIFYEDNDGLMLATCPYCTE